MNILKTSLVCILFASVMNIGYAKDLTQSDLNQASAQHYSTVDFMLNKAYEQLTGSLETKASKEALIKAQKAWITFRDLNAIAVASNYEGGSIAPLIKNQALIEMTQNRTEALTTMYLNVITP